MNVLLQLTTAGSDTGPFNLYSDVDFFGVPFETGVTKVDLLAGYLSTLVPNGTTIVRVCSAPLYCANCIDIVLLPYCDNCTCYTIDSTPGNKVTYIDCDGVEQDFIFVSTGQLCAQNNSVVFEGDGIATPSGCCEPFGGGYICPTTTTTTTTI